MFCLDELAQLRRHREEFQRRGARLVVAAQSCEVVKLAEGLEAYCDPSRDLFREFGFGRAGKLDLLDLRIWGRALKGLLRGDAPPPPSGDIYQLGGAVVLDPEGNVLYHKGSQSITQLTDLDELLKAVGGS